MRLRTLLKASRLLTLTGADGKTRLAVEFAEGLAGRHGRVDLIELYALHDGAALAHFVAAAVAVGEGTGRSGVDVLDWTASRSPSSWRLAGSALFH